jgi:LITAF-like zinc ribbon domain
MVLVVKCLICGKELNYSKSDPNELIIHVRNEHPYTSKAPKRNLPLKHKSQEDLRRTSAQTLKSIESLIQKTDLKPVGGTSVKRMTKRLSNDSAKSFQSAYSDSDEHFTTPMQTLSTIKEDDVVKAPSLRALKYNGTSAERGSSPTPAPRRHNRTATITANPNDQTPLLREISPKPPPRRRPVTVPGKPHGGMPHKHVSLRSPNRSRDTIDVVAGKGAKVLYTKEHDDANNPHHSSPPDNHEKKKSFKTSIERWRPVGDKKVQCPRCHSIKRPIVKTQTERFYESSLVSTVMMTCLPLCFSPCFVPLPAHDNLFCKVCNYHLGIYDHKKQLVFTNTAIESSD